MYACGDDQGEAFPLNIEATSNLRTEPWFRQIVRAFPSTMIGPSHQLSYVETLERRLKVLERLFRKVRAGVPLSPIVILIHPSLTARYPFSITKPSSIIPPSSYSTSPASTSTTRSTKPSPSRTTNPRTRPSSATTTTRPRRGSSASSTSCSSRRMSGCSLGRARR